MMNNAKQEQRPRRMRSVEEKRRIVEETLVPGASVSVVARRHDVNANQLFTWRLAYQRGALNNGTGLVAVGVIGEDGDMVPVVSDLATAKPTQSSGACSEPRSAAAISNSSKMAKVIEVELRGGTRIRIDADVGASALRQVLALVRSLA